MARPNRGGTPCAETRAGSRTCCGRVRRARDQWRGRGDGRPAPRGNVARRYPSTSCHRQSARRKCGRDAAGLHTATRAACHRPRAPPFASLRARRVARDAPHPLASPPARRRATPVEATRRLSDTVSSGGAWRTTRAAATPPPPRTPPSPARTPSPRLAMKTVPSTAPPSRCSTLSSAPPWRMTPTDTAPRPPPQSPSPASSPRRARRPHRLRRSPSRRPAPGGSRHPPRPHPRPDPPPVQDPHQALGLGRSHERAHHSHAFAWLVSGPCEIVPRESDGLPPR